MFPLTLLCSPAEATAVFCYGPQLLKTITLHCKPIANPSLSFHYALLRDA